MKFDRSLFLLSFASLASLALAGGTTTVQASGGSVAGINNAGGGWIGLQQTAYNATIDYGSASGGPSDFKLRQGSPSTDTGQVGTPSNNNVFSNSQTTADGTVTTQGKGTVSTASGDAPTYYDATWQTTTSASTSSTSFGSGTYDPWAVYARDIIALGTGLNQTADLYYQATLFGGSRSLTGFNLTAGQTSTYDFSIGNTDINGPSLLDIKVSSDNTFAASLNLQPKFSVYLLDTGSASNAGLTPYQRTSAQYGAIEITSAGQLTSLLSSYGLQNGSFNRNLDFGVLYKGFVLTTNEPNQVVFNWTTDNTSVQVVPEPASFAALGVGALAFLRRRARR